MELKAETYKEAIEKLLSKKVSKLKDYVVTINNDEPFFEVNDFEVIEGNPNYYELDEYNIYK